jgi:Ran GTPase-activating protein (RanGAP) involved in mRNA processing and transport
MGDAFGKGLKQTAGVGEELDLSKKLIGGDRPTMVAAVAQLMHGLVSLSLRENKLTDGEGVKMVEALQANTTLAQLDLGGNELGAESGKAMVEALKTNTAFRTVTLDGAVLSIAELTLLKNRFDVESATMLAKIGAERGIMLSGMKRDQTEADFSSRGLQPADAILIGSDLQFMAVLTKLVLYTNSIEDEGAKAIAEALKVNPVVSELELGDNEIGDEGAKAIAEALKVNAVLTVLGLTGNEIGYEGAKAIAEALKVNAVLTKLDLEYNYSMGNAGKKAVRDAVKGRSGFVLEL